MRLHDYVNLYFNARNPMMYKDIHGGICSGDELCVLKISPTVVDLPNVVFTDRNASSEYARFRPSSSGLSLVGNDTFAESWKHPGNEVAEWEHKSRMCAEVLVPNVIPDNYIVGAYVSCDSARRRLAALAPTLAITVNARMFFK